MGPVGNSIRQLVLLSETLVLFEDVLLDLFQYLGVVLQTLPVENMNYLLYVVLILLLAPTIFVLLLVGRLFDAHLLELFFQFVVTFFVCVEKQDFEEKMQQVDYCIRVGKELVVWVALLGNDVGFLADLAFEVAHVYELVGEHQVGDQQMEEFLLDLGVKQDLVRNVAEG